MTRKASLVLLVGLSLSLVPLLTSCPGPDDGGHKPTISNLSFAPPGFAHDNAAGGSVNVAVSFDYRDSEGDIKSVQVTTFDSSGNVKKTQTKSVSSFAGPTEGAVLVPVTVDTTPPDIYRIQFSLLDEEGNRSNALEGLFPVVLLRSSSPRVLASGSAASSAAFSLGAARGVVIGTTTEVFVADSQGGRILRIPVPSQDCTTYGSTIPFAYDLDFNTSGDLFVSSRSGPGNNIHTVPAASPLSSSFYPTGYPPGFIDPAGLKIRKDDNSLFIADSGSGTIVRKPTNGPGQAYLSGYSAPNGPCGLSFDSSNNLYFVDHATGRIFRVDASKTVTLLATLQHMIAGTSSALAFTAVDPSSGAPPHAALYVSDSLTGSIYKILSDGTVTLFASGFSSSGPGGMAFNAIGSILYVADGGTLWKIQVQ